MQIGQGREGEREPLLQGVRDGRYGREDDVPRDGVPEDDSEDAVEVVEKGYKPLQIAGKWILHISYFIFLLGGFGGLVSAINERDVLGQFYLFSGLFLFVIFFICMLSCSLCYLASACSKGILRFLTTILYVLLIAHLCDEIFLSFVLNCHILGNFSQNETYPAVQKLVESGLNWTVLHYNSRASQLFWDHIQPYLNCCGVQENQGWQIWEICGGNWTVPLSCCRPVPDNNCIHHPSNSNAFLDKGCLPRLMPYVKIVFYEIRIVLFFSLALSIAVLDAIYIKKYKSRDEEGPLETRMVKLGRKLVKPIFQHWAVQVRGKWYEIAGGSCSSRLHSGFVDGSNEINEGTGFEAPSGAGKFGGEIVGKTKKSEQQITDWIEEWKGKHPRYDAAAENCQKFAYDFIVWLTGGVFTVPHRFDAALSASAKGSYGGFTILEEGNTIWRYGSGDNRLSAAHLGIKYRWTQFQYQRIFSPCNPGLGLFLDVSVMRLEASLGNLIGFHVDYNLNTGVGARNGNFEIHLLGFGGRVGGDGLDVDTFMGGGSGIGAGLVVFYIYSLFVL